MQVVRGGRRFCAAGGQVWHHSAVRTDDGEPGIGEALSGRGGGAAADWRPNWILEDRDGGVVGLAVDDGCYVVLYQHDGQWRPGTHIPQTVARFIAELETDHRPA